MWDGVKNGFKKARSRAGSLGGRSNASASSKKDSEELWGVKIGAARYEFERCILDLEVMARSVVAKEQTEAAVEAAEVAKTHLGAAVTRFYANAPAAEQERQEREEPETHREMYDRLCVRFTDAARPHTARAPPLQASCVFSPLNMTAAHLTCASIEMLNPDIPGFTDPSQSQAGHSRTNSLASSHRTLGDDGAATPRNESSAATANEPYGGGGTPRGGGLEGSVPRFEFCVDLPPMVEPSEAGATSVNGSERGRGGGGPQSARSNGGKGGGGGGAYQALPPPPVEMADKAVKVQEGTTKSLQRSEALVASMNTEATEINRELAKQAEAEEMILEDLHLLQKQVTTARSEMMGLLRRV